MISTTAIRRNVLVATLGLLAVALALAATAFAAKPARGSHFSGHTAVSAVNGFFAPVTFTVSSDGKSLKSFSFGSFGCFGAGGFRPGVNPYTGNSILHVGTVKVSSSGSFSVSGVKSSSRFNGGLTITTTMSVAGHFTKAKAATGSITFSQKESGANNFSCGPAHISFSATGH